MSKWQSLHDWFAGSIPALRLNGRPYAHTCYD